ncbi:MAG: hypothetical protein JO323_05090 [Acidobacteriia bacterium]|nr:hypothetical protein [Terriglobia bacterium]
MKKLLAISFLSLTGIVLFAQGPRGGRFGMPGAPIRGIFSRTPVTGAPFSAGVTYQSQQLLAGGNQITRTDQEKVYRDSQGRTRIERTITPPASSSQQAFTEITITDPVAGYRYELNSATMTAVQSSLPKAPSTSGTAPTRPARPNAPDVTTTNLGTQTINGVLATGTQTTETIAAGAIGNTQAIQIVRISWVSSDLKIPVEIKTSDPRFGSTDMEVTNIVRSDPAASLFVVPSGYTIKTGGPGPGMMRRGRPFGSPQ